jgi:hypothetical protein
VWAWWSVGCQAIRWGLNSGCWVQGLGLGGVGLVVGWVPGHQVEFEPRLLGPGPGVGRCGFGGRSGARPSGGIRTSVVGFRAWVWEVWAWWSAGWQAIGWGSNRGRWVQGLGLAGVGLVVGWVFGHRVGV